MKRCKRPMFILLFFLLTAPACGDGAFGTGLHTENTDSDTVVYDDRDMSQVDTDMVSDGDSMPDSDTAIPACGAVEGVPAAREFSLVSLSIDLSRPGDDTVPVSETITVTPSVNGHGVALYGVGLSDVSADVPFTYEDGVLTLCTPVTAGREVQFSLNFWATMRNEDFGLSRWYTRDGDVIIGPFSEPYYATRWLFSPQSTYEISPVLDRNVVVSDVAMHITLPDSSWVVAGPGGIGTRSGDTVSFRMDVPMPLYTLSFTAADTWEYVDPEFEWEELTGVNIAGYAPDDDILAAEAVMEYGAFTVAWMGETLGEFEFDDMLLFVPVPDFGGGMEHVSAIWIDSGMYQYPSYAAPVIVHETVHHWIGNSIRFADWPDFWLVEGLDEWLTNFNIIADLPNFPGDIDERERYYRDSAVDNCSDPATGPLSFDPADDFMVYFASHLSLYYTYGCMVFEMIDHRLRRRFDTDLLTVLERWNTVAALRTVTTGDFMEFLIDETEDRDFWKRFFTEWVYASPCPVLSVSGYSAGNGTVSFTVSRRQGVQTLADIPIVLVYGDGTTEWGSFSMAVDESEADFSFETDVEPVEIRISPGYSHVFGLITDGWNGPDIRVNQYGTGTVLSTDVTFQADDGHFISPIPQISGDR